ncbi:putative bifunctional diguanylate cyclase/phosphodiesterase [Massilia sp. GCM10020059]|uniref:EAL domain-containing protein n=1 Tax=Massilia agrisoli TaxID=2892444 RepID=A0ABS8IW21_9BURK|nr:EAL domain-containing protein [Massilia agrisoli]MCC6072681.1 EAL domain-containing protein [Massilia agrisoli]
MGQDDRQELDEERLKLVLEAADLDLWENDLVSGEVTRRAARVFGELGYSGDETARLIDDLFSLVHPDDLPVLKSALQQHMEGVTPHYRCEFRLRTKTGAWVWYANHGKIVDSGDGVRGRRLIGVSFNIDERKQSEERVRDQQRLLAESESRYRELLSNLRTGIVVHGPDTSIAYSNARAHELLGLSEDEIRGKLAPDRTWRFVDEQGAPLPLAHYPVNRVLASGQAIESQVLGVIQRGGAPVWLLVSAFPEFKGDGALKQVVVNFDDITPRKHAEQEIHQLAFYDSLTGLPNRRMLMDRLHEALAASARSQRYGAVLFIDMDNFKAINDVLGHSVGDLMLVEAAARIGHCLREADMVARLGGDEFVVLVAAVQGDAGMAAQRIALIAEKIRTSLSAPYQLLGHERHSSPSIGVAMFLGGGQGNADTVIRQADMAMYKAKDAGRNTFRFFSAAMQLAVESRAALEADLRLAIGLGQLQLHYQVQVDARQNVLGAEALVRWRHPVRGLVSPLQFIPIAEESSLILEIGNWVLDTACAQLARWQDKPALRHLTLAVNVSARQFRQADFVDMLRAIVERHPCDVSRLKLELTESMVLSDVAEVVHKMESLQALGLSLSMDDFGTGYSSLAYLKKLPLAQIKIDQSFVRDITTDAADAVMVKTIIDLARNFHLEVIAEGVETVEQLEFLRAHGCAMYQGFLFGKPQPVEAFEEQLATRGAVVPA